MIVLDTHAWLWWAADEKRLSARARGAIEGADALGVCTISCWELAMLKQRGRIELDRPVRTWIGQALAQDRVRSLALTSEIAIAAALLDSQRFHGDPADRIIYATALAHRSALATKDSALRDFDRETALW